MESEIQAAKASGFASAGIGNGAAAAATVRAREKRNAFPGSI